MSEAAKEKTPIANPRSKARLQQELPRWVYEGGWIRRTYKTTSWKGTLMVINTVGHLAEAAWHHRRSYASYAWVEVRLQNHAAKGITDKDFDLARKIEDVVFWQPGKEGGALEGTPTDQRFSYIDYKKAKHRCVGKLTQTCLACLPPKRSSENRGRRIGARKSA